MNIRTLKYLVAIETYGSISEAAKRMYITQPYLSKILRDTEEEYNVTIFARGKKGLSLTERGKLFLDMARDLIEESDQFIRLFRGESGRVSLKIAAFPSSYAMDAYLRMLKTLPEQAFLFHYKEEPTADVIEDVHSQAADLGVIFLKEKNEALTREYFKAKRLICARVFDTRLHLIVRCGHPLTEKADFTLEDLYSWGLVMYYTKKEARIYSLEDGYYNKASLSDLIDFEKFRRIIYIYNRGSMHNILQQTDFIALGSQATLEQGRNFGLVSLPFPFPGGEQAEEYDNTLYYIYRNDRPLSEMARLYTDTLVKYYSGEKIEKTYGLIEGSVR